MPHENENPLIIDVVGEVESPRPIDQQDPKRVGRAATKRSFFKREKAVADTTATQAASAAEVDAAKRAAVAASVPPVQGPAPQPVVSQAATVAPEPSMQQPVSSQPVQPEQPQPVVQPVQSQAPSSMEGQSQQQFQAEAPHVQAPPQQSQQSQQSQQPMQQPAPQPMNAEQPQIAQNQQSQSASQPVVQPVQPNPVPVPMASQVVQGNMAAAVPEQRNTAVYVFGVLAALVMVFALSVAAFFVFFQPEDRTPLVPTIDTDLEAEEVRPIGSVSLDQASKVSLRVTAEGWTEEGSTPVIAYIKRVEGASDEEASDGEAASDERYFAFAPNKNASVSLPAGRYTFSFIAPMNSDGSMYAVPDTVSMVVGDGGMAVLPVDLVMIAKDDLTQEQVTHALAQLKTASDKGGESFEYEPFKKSIDLALNTWFPQNDATTEQPATDLTQEQQDALNAQADSQSSSQGDEGAASDAAAEHAHDWIAQHEQRWEPEIVQVIDTPAWESPVYARYRCQEGILFETLSDCLTHVRERGNEPYAESNEIIRIDYHPAVVHYEEQGRYVDVITGYRCSVCGVRGTLD